MADFVTAFNYMIYNEDSTLSGVVITDNDGGKTRLGLDSKSNPDLVAADFYTETLPQALVMAKFKYRQKYWDTILGDLVKNQGIASKFLDMAVNEGTEEATKLVQRATYGIAHDPKIDGKMGPMTLQSLNSDNPTDLMRGIISWWNWFIRMTLVNNPKDELYVKSWVVRANKIPLIGSV